LTEQNYLFSCPTVFLSLNKDKVYQLLSAPPSFYFLAWAVTQSKSVGARLSKIKLIITLIDTYPDF